ncbi:MAG: hypothetical protein V4857_01755 [Pseudomonadota bacterium]
MKTLFQSSEADANVDSVSPHCALLDPPMPPRAEVAVDGTARSGCGRGAAWQLRSPVLASWARQQAGARTELSELRLSGRIDELQDRTIDASIIGLP